MQIEALRPGHARAAFRSGVAWLDGYFKSQAGRDAAKSLAAVFVLLLPEQRIAGFYTLAPATLFLPDLRREDQPAAAFPPMPAARLTRLAVDQRLHGRGLGRFLLADALRRARNIPAPPVAMVAEAAAPAGRDFYLRAGFQPFPDRPSQLFRPLT
jgi:GNAT superfamily N-acetyltransferase